MEQKIIDILSKRGYLVVNPFVTEEGLNQKYGTPGYYEKPSIPFAHDIVKEDYEILSSCEEYFGWLPKGMTIVGTVVEMMWACKQGKPVTTLSYKPSPFLLVYSDKFYGNIEEFLQDRPSWVRKNLKDLERNYCLGFKELRSLFACGETNGED